MELKKIREQQNAILQYLNDKRIKDALDLLEPLVRDTHQSDLIDARYNLEFSYKSILKYTTEGINDPERQKIYNHLLTEVYQIADTTIESLLSVYSGEIAYELIRKNQLTPQQSIGELTDLVINQHEDILLRSSNQAELILTAEFLEAESNLFHSLWLFDNNYTSIRQLFDHAQLPWHTKALMVSAILLHLLRKWNQSLLFVLFDLTQHEDHRIQMRALTALIISLRKYDNRLMLYPEVINRLDHICEDPIIINHIQTLFIQLIRTRETEVISDRMRNEILPEVIKIHPLLREKLDLDNLAPESGDDKNPEWTEVFADSPELLNKLEELTKWQMEGADVFLTTFQMLKHFAFFNAIPNWFMPFLSEHPTIQQALSNSGDALKNSLAIKHIAQAGALCNSDKYSLFFGIPLMPPAQQEMMGQMFSNELEQMDELQKDELLINPSKRDYMVSNQYIQDLYRFFKLHPDKQQFEDIFTWKMDFYKNNFFKHLFHTPEPIEQMGAFLFSKNFHADALDIYSLLSHNAQDNAEYTQKMAYCQLQLNHHEEALNLFLKADLLQPQKAWTLKKIALCYRHLQQPRKALEYYMAAALLFPDNLQTQAAIGHCQLELNNYDEALKNYFKVEYLDPKNNKVWRPITWCSLVTGKFEQAEKYCLKLLENENNPHDLINMGHIYLCTNKRKEALEYYQQSIQAGLNIDSFLKIFAEDKKQLIKQGIQPDDLPILIDQLRYSIG